MVVEYLVSEGLVSDYQESINFMEQRVKAIIANEKQELLWFLQYQPLYTAGSSYHKSELLRVDIPVYRTNRGGKVTYHGPGIQVVYLMLDLRKRNLMDLHLYVYLLEEMIISFLKQFEIEGFRRKNRVGIWVYEHNQEKKIASIGVRVKKWVSYHGIAINIDPDLSYFDGIIPCGISDFGVTSLARMKHGLALEVDLLTKILIKKFKSIYNLEVSANPLG